MEPITEEEEVVKKDLEPVAEESSNVELESDDIQNLRKEFDAAVNIPASDNEDEDGDDDVPDMQNRAFKPFRNPGEEDNSDARSAWSSGSTIIDPEDVKQRVRASMSRRAHSEAKRRISKKGVACVVNRRRREDKDDIKTSTSAFWGGD
jgi:hypothetical protein